MALAYKCDRCDSFFEEYENVSDVRLYGSMHLLYVGADPQLHLCPECAKSLDWWFKNPIEFTTMLIDPAKCEKKKRWWQK